MSERSCQDTSKNGRAHAPSRTASFLPDGDVNHCDWQWLLYVCAVTRRRFPVGASPTRQSLQPEATGAVMEVTKWHCQTKFYTASWRSGAGGSPLFLLRNRPTRSARFDAENDLY